MNGDIRLWKYGKIERLVDKIILVEGEQIVTVVSPYLKKAFPKLAASTEYTVNK